MLVLVFSLEFMVDLLYDFVIFFLLALIYVRLTLRVSFVIIRNHFRFLWVVLLAFLSTGLLVGPIYACGYILLVFERGIFDGRRFFEQKTLLLLRLLIVSFLLKRPNIRF